MEALKFLHESVVWVFLNIKSRTISVVKILINPIIIFKTSIVISKKRHKSKNPPEMTLPKNIKYISKQAAFKNSWVLDLSLPKSFAHVIISKLKYIKKNVDEKIPNLRRAAFDE